MKGWKVKALGAVVVVVLLVVLYAWSALSPPSGPKAITGPMTFDNVTLVMPAQSRTEAAAIGIENGRIAAVGKQGTVRVGAVRDDYAGMYVMPGLIDMHSHLPPDSPLKITRYFGLLYIAYGVTTIRDAGDVDGTAYPAAIREWEEEGHAGPRHLRTGPFIVGSDPLWSNSIVVETPDDVRNAVAELKAAGAHGVKSYENLPLELVHELGRAAEEAGLWVMGHIPRGLSFEEALVRDTQHYMGVPPVEDLPGELGADSLSAWQGVDDARIAEVVQAALANDIANTPVLFMSEAVLQYRDYNAARERPDVRLMPRMFRDVVWSPVEGIRIWRGLTEQQFAALEASQATQLKLTNRLFHAGAKLHIGTDTMQPFIVPGAAVHREMEMFLEAGVPAEDVMAIASWKGAQALNIDGLGTLDLDAPADLVIFRDDPTTGLHTLHSIEAVVSQGRLYTREELDKSLAAFQKHFDGALFDSLSTGVTRRMLASATAGEE